MHELRGVHPDASQEDVDLRVGAPAVELCAAWRVFYDLYTSRDWDAAAAALALVRARFGEDSLIVLYETRLKRFAAEPPPADWDGVTRYREK
ncbi:hypothetical protein D3C83_94410 [compost metagenome]